MRSEGWWSWLALLLLVGGCGKTRSNCELCAAEPSASAGKSTGGSAGNSAGGAGAGPSGGTTTVAGQTNQGGATLLGCGYGAPAAPLVPYSQVDLEWTMDDLIGPGPSFQPAYEARSDAGQDRPVSTTFVGQLQTLASARLDTLSLEGAPLTLCEANVTDRSACVDSWIRERGLRIYRRPLTDEQVAGYVEQFSEQASAASPEAAARQVLLSMLLSPYFVFRIELGVQVSKALTIWPPNGGAPAPLPSRGNPLSSYEVAARLSHFAWRAGPDAVLLGQAAANRLQEPQEVLTAFDRLLADPRSLRARTLQQLEWLHLEQWGALEPQTPSEIASLQREQAERFIADVLQARNGSFSELLTSARQPFNRELAKQMGIDVAVGDSFELFELDASLYAGVLGQSAWLSRSPRPTLRGVRILSQFLCTEVPPPPPSVPPGLGAGATPRERITSATTSPTCRGCHQFFDPTGFALEAFDEQGRLTGFDTTGTVQLPEEGPVELAGPRELGQSLAASHAAKACAAKRAVEYLLQTQLRDSNDQAWLECLVQGIGFGDLSLNQLARQIAFSDAMLRTPATPSSAVGVGSNADPVQHAIEETRSLILGLPQEAGLPLQQYVFALQELQGPPPLP
jgi:Protein of unknown function (DUF1592)/Protein of unknown function (DUF1588)/Protein of unknown function (DUF1595)